jgi:predicted DCC family thiol-disulfide oxidoreductase YuxK
MSDSPLNHKIILFDGVCNLCNTAVNFVISHDKKNRFKFAPLQEATGKKIMKEFHIDSDKTDSIVLIDNGRAYIKSGAALRIAKNLNGAYPLLYFFMVFPAFIRDGVYDWVAKNRYRWFGKQESCRVPTPELKEKFL